MKRRHFIHAAVAGLTVVGLSACSGDAGDEASTPAGPRPITDAEANRLAVARFNNFDRGVVPVTLTYVDRQRNAKFVGRVDFATGQGLVDLIEAGQPTGAVAWNLKSLASHNGAAANLPKFPTTGWQARALDPAASLADAAFLVLLNLGFDRPDNPLLLQRNGSTWEGSTTIGAHQVDRMSGPIPVGASKSSLTYFVDQSGRLIRAQADINTGQAKAVIEFGDGAAPAMPDLTGILPAVASSSASASPTP